MTYKSIFTIWDGRPDSRAALDTAIELVREADGHLNVLCLGVDHTQAAFYYAGGSPSIMAENVEVARGDAARFETEAEEILSREAINYSVQTMVAQIGGIAWTVGQAARFNDLAVLPRPYGKNTDQDLSAILEAAMFEGDAPVLVCPPGKAGIPGGKVVIGWNESTEALRAVKAALPLLGQATTVDVAVIDPPRHDEDRADPGAELSKMLTRHGVDVSVSILARTLPKVSETLMQHAADIGAGLVVIGAYGHSRFRESILGGATRDLLETATLPVFMTH